MRGVGELALGGDVGDGFVGGYEQQTGVGQASFEEPFVGRFMEMLDELLLERGQALVAQRGQLFGAQPVEYVSLDDLFESFGGQVGILQDSAFDAALRMGEKQVDEFGGLQLLDGGLDRKSVV